MMQYIFMGIILLVAIAGMIAAYYYGKLMERKRIIKNIMAAGIDLDGDTISTIHLASIVFNNANLRQNGGDDK